MTPTSFTFKLTVPADMEVLPIVTGLARHASTFANLDAATGTDFVKRVTDTATRHFNQPSSGHCLIVFLSNETELKATIGSETVSGRRSG